MFAVVVLCAAARLPSQFVFVPVLMRYNSAEDHLWFCQLAALTGGQVLRPKQTRLDSSELAFGMLYLVEKCVQYIRMMNQGGAMGLEASRQPPHPALRVRT